MIACTAAVAAACRAALEGPRSGEQPNSVYSIHTGINIALFPVLFFFSGLYYTDVISTFIVLVAYLDHLGRLRQDKGQRSLFKDLYTVLLGILALFMRQTNVFWVVVYMGGVEAVQALRELPVVNNKPARDTWLKQGKFFVWKSSNGAVHDPPLQDAWPDDLVSCLLSIGIAAIFNIGPILRQVYPRLIVAGLFAGFVVWNGGVVLGDKSNHVATLHLAQMLYIWPLFAFFSAPIFLPQALRLLQSIKGYVALKPTNEVSEATMKTQQPHPASKPLNYTGILLSVFVLGGSVIITGLIVHYNTIIHPFTLADNRHYMFYVFRYTVMRGPVVRVLLAPAYVFCAILVWTTLYQLKPDVPPVAANSEVSPTDSGAATSQVIILLATITLSLMTAPLVEPRYFILPWLFWRLLVPQRTGSRRDSWDWTLFLETTWFLLVNGILMYIFITRPFVWKMQDGTVLDGGNVQRFMW